MYIYTCVCVCLNELVGGKISIFTSISKSMLILDNNNNCSFKPTFFLSRSRQNFPEQSQRASSGHLSSCGTGLNCFRCLVSLPWFSGTGVDTLRMTFLMTCSTQTKRKKTWWRFLCFKESITPKTTVACSILFAQGCTLLFYWWGYHLGPSSVPLSWTRLGYSLLLPPVNAHV